jgi:hypothetical protein
VVNDIGGELDGSGRSTGPAHDVVEEIVAAGGEATVNGDDISTWDGAERLIAQAVDTFGTLDVVVNNAGILRDRMLANMTEAEWDAVIAGAPQGHLRPGPPRRGLLARQGQGGRARRRTHHQHLLAVGHLRQRRPDQLRRGQGRHRRLHRHRGQGTGPLRRHRERHRPRRAHPHDREPRHGPSRRHDQSHDVASLDRPGRDVAGLGRVRRRHRSGVRRDRPGPVGGRRLAPWPHPEHPTDDPAELGAVVRELVAEARPNANMLGYDER